MRESLVSVLRAHLARKHGGESPVKIDQLLRDGMSFAVVGVKEGLGVGGEAVDGIYQFPGQVVGVHHGYIHSLTGFGAMCMASCIAFSISPK